MKEGSMAIAINVTRLHTRPQRRRQQFFILNKTNFTNSHSHIDFTLMHTQAFLLISTNMYVSGQGYLWWQGGQGAPSVKVGALRALVDLNGLTWGLPLHPSPGVPFQLHPAASRPAWVMSYGVLVSSSATAVPVLGHRPHWLGLWAADWLLAWPGTCFVTVDLPGHQHLCLTLVIATRPDPDSDPDPDQGIHFISWPWTCLTTADLSDELDSWLTPTATHEHAPLPRSGAVLSHLVPAS